MKLTKNIKKRITIAAMAAVIGSSSIVPVLGAFESQAAWHNTNNMWTYTDTMGNSVTGWVKDNEKWYYLGQDGIMRTGWQKIDNNWYYLNKDGAMVTGKLTINGIAYVFDENGAMQSEGNENSDPSEDAYLKQAIDLINASRKGAGLSELTVNEQLTAAAQVRATEAAENLTYTRPDGTDYYTAVDAVGYKWADIGENLAKGATTPQSAVSAWMNSDSHKENILASDYTEIGLAVVPINGSYYIAAIFGTPVQENVAK